MYNLMKCHQSIELPVCEAWRKYVYTIFKALQTERDHIFSMMGGYPVQIQIHTL